jgi:chemotaxis protein histidine kinase CheA
MDARRAAQLATFRNAVTERLSRLGVTWIQIESGVASPAARGEMLRELHTMKGEAAILGFTAATAMLHVLEAAIQRGAPEIGDAVLAALDALATLVMGDPNADTSASVEALITQLSSTNGAERASEPAATGNIPTLPRKTGVRIEASQLDRMRHAIGDLLSLRIRMRQLAEDLRTSRASGSLEAQVKRSEAQLKDDALVLTTLVGALDDTVRELRLVPVGSILERYPRIARDLGRELGKSVRVELEGEAAGVDRDVIEALDGALLHLVRNAVDHGIETADVRRARGKPEVGTIRITATVSASQLHLTITDDGGGIDVDAVRRVAVERGLVDARVDATDERALHWIMMPGFSTRGTATQVSGRGVGLDAAHASAQALGGSLTVTTQRGRGTTFELTAPIDTALTTVLLFYVGDARYAFPAGSVEDVVDAAAYRIEDSLGGPVIAYRGNDLPIVPLGEALDRTSSRIDRPRFVVVHTGLGSIACAGSHGHEHREAVLRPVGSLLSAQTIATAAIVLEDGEVALMLNPARLRTALEQVHAAPAQVTAATVLVVDDSPIIRDLVAEVLRSHGLLVVEAADGVEALALLRERSDITLVVTDVEMPRMDGLELIRQIRAERGRRLPAVVVSARGSDDDKKRASSIGADAYLVKTDLTHDSLWDLIGRFVSTP